MCGGLRGLIDYPLVVLHLHQLLLLVLLAVHHHLLLATLVRCSGCTLVVVFFLWRVPDDKVVNLGEDLHVTTVVHHYDVVVVA